MRTANEDLLAIERIKRGDAGAFTRLYKKCRDRVYGFSYRMLSDQTAAEDVTHEVFLVLIQYPEKYQPARGSLLTFLCAIARNNILNHFRRRIYEAEDGWNEEEFYSIKDAYEIDPLSSLIELELSEKVDEYISMLPPLQREVIILRKFEEMSYREISEITGAEVERIGCAKREISRTESFYGSGRRFAQSNDDSAELCQRSCRIRSAKIQFYESL